MLLSVVLIEKVASEQRFEEVETVNHVAFRGKSIPTREKRPYDGKRLVCLKNSSVVTWLEQEGQGWEMKREVWWGAGKERLTGKDRFYKLLSHPCFISPLDSSRPPCMFAKTQLEPSGVFIND